jgi:hypothetical protein
MRRGFFSVLGIFVAVTLAQAQESSFALKPEALAGEWTISDSNPSGGCRLALEFEKNPFGYPAYAFGCTADDLLQVTRWRLRGTSIILSGDRGAPIILLKIKDRNRFQGRSYAGRRIVLSR